MKRLSSLPAGMDAAVSGRPARRKTTINTTLMDLVNTVRKEVNEQSAEGDRIVALVVFRLLGGEGWPEPGSCLAVFKRGKPGRRGPVHDFQLEDLADISRTISGETFFHRRAEG